MVYKRAVKGGRRKKKSQLDLEPVRSKVPAETS